MCKLIDLRILFLIMFCLLCWTGKIVLNLIFASRLLFHNNHISVGKKIVNEALSSNPPFDIYFGIDGWMLSMLTSGMNPVTSLRDAAFQVALMGLLRFVSLFYLMDFGRITQNCHDAKQEKTKDASKED